MPILTMRLSALGRIPGKRLPRWRWISAVGLWAGFPGMLSAEIGQQAYLKARNGEEGDNFGGKVAISGNTLVVDAWNRFSTGRGVDGDESVVPLEQRGTTAQAGAAYVFVKIAEGAWVQQAYLRGIGPGRTVMIGMQLAIDGDVVVLAEPNGRNSAETLTTGVVDIFSRNDGRWQAEARLEGTDSGEKFGNAVALSGDTLVVGCADAVKVFQRRKEETPAFPTGYSWVPQAVLKLEESIPNGRCTAAFRGDLMVLCYAGAAYVYDRSGGEWSLQGRLAVPGNQNYQFINPVTNGKLAMVTSMVDGKIQLFTFQRQGTEWKLYRTLARNEAGFGRSVALSGNSLLVGAPDTNNIYPGAGVAFLYRTDAPSWDTPLAQLRPNNSKAGNWFGYSVALDGDQAVIGAPKEDRHPRPVTGGATQLMESGAAYVFDAWRARFSLTDFGKQGDEFILNFSGTPQVQDWVIKGSADPSIFSTDMTSRTIITEDPPGQYRAAVDISGAGPRFFLKLEHD